MKVKLYNEGSVDRGGGIEFQMVNKVGLDGRSAYEIAVEKGFDGTEQEWLASISEPAYTAAAAANNAAKLAAGAASSAEEMAGKAAVAATNAENALAGIESSIEEKITDAVNVVNSTIDEKYDLAKQYSVEIIGPVVEDIRTLEDNLSHKAGLDRNDNYLDPGHMDPFRPYITGQDTCEGYFRTFNEDLFFDGPRSVEAFFRTGDDISSVGYVYSQKIGYLSSIHIRCGNNFLIVYVGNKEQYLSVEKNTVYHIVINYEGNCAQLLVNGKEYYLNGITNYQQPTDISVGNRDRTDTGFFQGTIGLIRVFDRALNSDEKYMLWNNGALQFHPLKGSIEGCCAEYLPKSISECSWRDTSGHGRDLEKYYSPRDIYGLSTQEKITEGNGAPSKPPRFSGQLYIDRTNKAIYMSIGSADASDWKLIS